MARKEKKKTSDVGFGLQKPEQPKVVTPPVKSQAPTPPPSPRPQPQQPKSAFPPLEVSGLGTIARGKHLNRLVFDRSPRARDGDTVFVRPEGHVSEGYRDPRDRPRAPGHVSEGYRDPRDRPRAKNR